MLLTASKLYYFELQICC